MTTKTKPTRFELPTVWTIGSMTIVPAYDERLNVRLFGQFRFVQQKSADAEEWRKTLENKWIYNRPAYYDEVKALWRWYRLIQAEIDEKLLNTKLHDEDK